MNDLHDKQHQVDDFVSSNFQVGNLGAGDVYNRNMPKYSNMLNNFQDFMVTMDQQDWRKGFELKTQQDYWSANNQENKATIDERTIKSAHFQDPQNLQSFIN